MKVAPLIHIADGQSDEILGDIAQEYIIDDTHRQSLEDTLETYEFYTFGDQPFTQHLKDRNRIIIPDEDGSLREFIIYESEKYRDTEGYKMYVIGTASYLDLKKASVIRPGSFTGTASQHIGIALNDTEWRPGIVEVSGTKTIHRDDFTNPFDYLKTLAREFEGELRFRIEHNGNRITGRFVDLLERIGEWRGREIEFGKDLDGIRRIENTERIVTALIGLGPEREDGTRLEVFVEDTDALQRWGRPDPVTGELRHLIEVYEPESDRAEMTEEELRQYTRTELNKRINAVVTYECSVVDLENVPGMENKQIRFGDTIKIKDTKFNPPLYIEARVFEQERSIKSKAKKDIKLGDYIEYTEEEVDAIWNQLRNEIRRRLDRMAIVTINSTAGNIFKNAQGETQLTARTFVNGAERDEDGTLYDYQWMRFDKDGNHDTEFYAEGKTITVKASDIDEKATYRVLVAYELEVINTAEITISNVFDGEDGEPGPPGPNRVDENTEFGEGYNPIEKATPEDIEEAIDNLEIGGRNYITHNPDKWETVLSAYHTLLVEVEPNTTYTFTDYSTEAVSYLMVGSEEDLNMGDGKLVEKGETYTFESGSSGVIGIIAAEKDFKERLGTIFRFKLEKGNKATDWTPAPEDVQEQIDEAKQEAGEAKQEAEQAKQEAEEAKQTAQQAQTTADGKNSVFHSPTAPPTAGRKIGDIWFDTSRDNLMHRFNGIEWVEAKWGEQSIVANSITANHIKSLDGLNVNDQFIVDSQGNVKFAGSLEGATGTFSGTIEASEIIGSSFQAVDPNQTENPSSITIDYHTFLRAFNNQEEGTVTEILINDYFSLATYDYRGVYGLIGHASLDFNSLTLYERYLGVANYEINRIFYDPKNLDHPFTFDMPKAKFTGSVEIDSFSNPLWTGALYPLSTHTIIPSKRITQCTTGWILRWQAYNRSDGTVVNSDFHYVHIPKIHVINNNGAGVRFVLARGGVGVIGKYVYVYDDRIVGHDSNNQDANHNLVLTGVFEY